MPLIGCADLKGWQQVGRVLEVDQTPIGKTPRSCPATYVGFWDAIRRLFAETNEARMRGWTPSRFSFNTAGGRCDACEGQGIRRIEMSFLPDVRVLCEACGGQRFNTETLAVTWRGKNIGEVLNMAVDEAVEFFASMPNIAHPLQLLKDVPADCERLLRALQGLGLVLAQQRDRSERRVRERGRLRPS